MTEFQTSWDTMLKCLQNRDRRRLLVALLGCDSEEHITVPEDIHTGERELSRLQIQLYHSHLPMLVDREYIQWNKENHIVEKGPNFDEIAPLVELIHQNQDGLPDDWI
ncbi:transcriptional regulator [Halomicroarcula limicola]|uniref:Transcriptional regulator n=1 Tax=Haloarcula limicola TaxID=1429915 RepID=A0A8J7YDN4_9EURY|nr:transcriptional regulator [Halomicroarcula limicola]MBV0924608.1 transcriptional regulator [Halomicroarcula limicola]